MSGLTGKKYIGKIVKGLDPECRGRYKVHIPEILQHQAETEGIFCMNEINGSRIGGSSRGMTGSYKPLYEGQVVAVVFTTDDINSARIVEVVSDELESKIPSFKKICCGDTGYIQKERNQKSRSNLPIILDINQIIKQFNNLLVTARNTFGNLVDTVNELNVKLTRKNELKKIDDKKKEENKKEENKKNITTFTTKKNITTFTTKNNNQDKISYDSYFKDTYGRNPTPEESELMQIAGGVKTEDKYIVEKKQDWEKTEPEKINNNANDGSRDLNNTSKEEGPATAQESQDDRDEETIIAMTPNKSGIAIMEKSSSNPDSILIIHKAKQTAIKINDDGIYISTDLNKFERICINNDIQIDGTSSITVNGGNYDIYVNGKVNIECIGDFNVYSHGNINLKADNNINIESQNATTNIKSKDNININSENNINNKANNKINIDGNSKINLKSGDIISLDGSTVQLNSGTAESANSAAGADTAAPAKRQTCKL